MAVSSHNIPSASGDGSAGRVRASGPPGPDHPVPRPPETLLQAIAEIKARYPNDLFGAMMRYTAVSPTTGGPFGLPSNQQPPPDTIYYYYPRVQCQDCPGKLYTPDADLGLSNFENHLQNRHHRDHVASRIGQAQPDESRTSLLSEMKASQIEADGSKEEEARAETRSRVLRSRTVPYRK